MKIIHHIRKIRRSSMEHINLSGRKRESYKVDFSHSLLWECGLGKLL
jgi:hypothetical protein